MSADRLDPPPDEPPRHAPIGRVYATDGTTVEVRITYRSKDVLLTLLDDGTLYGHSLLGLTLESSGGRGVLRTYGNGKRIEANLIRFFPDARSDIVQRREYVRVTVAQPVVFVDAQEHVLLKTFTVNVSGGGMLVRRPRSVTLEGQPYFDLYLGFSEQSERISGRGRVIRQVGEDATAVGFSEISHNDRQRLIHFIFDKQRVALAITRGDAI